MFLQLLGRDIREQGGEHVVTEARQLRRLAEVGAQQVGQVGEQDIDAGQADFADGLAVAIDADVGQARNLAIVDRALGGAVHQLDEVRAVEQAGDQVLAADFAQLFFQLGVVRFGTDNHLDARLAVIGGRREAHARLEALAVGADPAARQFGIAFGAGVVLQEVLKAA